MCEAAAWAPIAVVPTFMKITGFLVGFLLVLENPRYCLAVGDGEDGTDDGLVEPPLGADFPSHSFAPVFPFLDNEEEGNRQDEQASHEKGDDEQLEGKRIAK